MERWKFVWRPALSPAAASAAGLSAGLHMKNDEIMQMWLLEMLQTVGN